MNIIEALDNVISKYTVPSKFTKQQLVEAIAYSDNLENIASKLGFNSGQVAGRNLRKIFPDKDTNIPYRNWLLAKIDSKFCENCSEVKLFEEFHICQKGSYGRNTFCKECSIIKTAIWAKNNPETAKRNSRISTAKYKAAKLNASPLWADKRAIKEIYNNCPQNMEVDHIVPLQGEFVSGLHVSNNLQYLTKSHNSGKRNKF